jgi:hypothetical protein
MIIRACIFLFIMTPFVSAAQVMLKGTLLDHDTKEPIPGAAVIVEGTGPGRITDLDGKFTIIIDSLTPRTKIKIMTVGYTTKVIRASSLTKSAQIFYMKPKVEWLQEVVVKAYAPRCTLKIQTCEPKTASTEQLWNLPFLCRIGGMIVVTQKERIIKTPEINAVKLYPNPVIAGGSVQASLQLKQPGRFHIDLIDAGGRVIWMKKLDINSTQYNLAIPVQSRLSAGMYSVRITGNQSQTIYNGKLMVQ